MVLVRVAGAHQMGSGVRWNTIHPHSQHAARMDRITVDLLVIGFGKGGKTLAGALGRQGWSVALVEQSPEMYGGTCINIACVPTKALIHDADARPPREDAARWYARAVNRKDALTAAMRTNNYEMLDRVDSVTVVTGRAAFIGPHEVRVTAGGDELEISA